MRLDYRFLPLFLTSSLFKRPKTMKETEKTIDAKRESVFLSFYARFAYRRGRERRIHGDSSIRGTRVREARVHPRIAGQRSLAAVAACRCRRETVVSGSQSLRGE